MKPRDHQAIFDTVARHLLQQGCAARLAGTCLLRGPNGTKCALGVLIPDELYTEDMERRSTPSALLEGYPKVAEAMGIAYDETPLLGALQFVHDETPANEWPEELRKVAADYALNARCVTAMTEGLT